MPSSGDCLRRVFVSCGSILVAAFLVSALILLPDISKNESAYAQEGGTPGKSLGPEVSSPSASPPSSPESQAPAAPVSKYDSAIFQKTIPGDQLSFLNRFSGKASSELVRDKRFHKLMSAVISDCMFHYGWDMPLPDALDLVLKGSTLPVRIRDGRYVMVSGRSGPYLMGRGFVWIDMQEGIVLGGFYFRPTNGEPTPSVTVFSAQVKQDALKLSQFPPAFAQDLGDWSGQSGVPSVTTRYFITGGAKKILLEHDEDYCAPADVTAAPAELGCEQLNADAADIDVIAAYYLEQTNYATNATAWMINGEDQVEWLQVRENTCGLGPGQLMCHIRMTRERTHVIITRKPVPHIPHVSRKLAGN